LNYSNHFGGIACIKENKRKRSLQMCSVASLKTTALYLQLKNIKANDLCKIAMENICSPIDIRVYSILEYSTVLRNFFLSLRELPPGVCR
jgi:hypothetical protein